METHQYDRSQRRILWFSYVMQILVFPAVIGVLINFMKIRQYAKPSTMEPQARPELITLLRSHHQWLMRTFVIFLFLFAVSLGTLYYGVGYVLGIGAIAWWMYRMVRGMIDYAEGKPMPA